MSQKTRADAVLCVLCFKPLNNAQLLRCGHKCCKVCAEGEGALHVAAAFAAGKEREEKFEVLCGVCGETTPFEELRGDGGAAERAVEAVKREMGGMKCMFGKCRAEGEKKCSACEQKGIPFVFCGEHVDIHDAMFGHAAEGVCEVEAESVVEYLFPKRMCDVHGCPMRYKCVECKKKVCGDCVLKGIHSKHTITELDISDEDRKKAQKALKKGRKVLEDAGKVAPVDFDKLVAEVQAEYAAIREMLDKEEEEVLYVIEKAREEESRLTMARRGQHAMLEEELRRLSERVEMMDKAHFRSDKISESVAELEGYVQDLENVCKAVNERKVDVRWEALFDKTRRFVDVNVDQRGEFVDVGTRNVNAGKFVQTDSDFLSTQSYETAIPAGFASPYSCQAVFDSKRRLVIETSWKQSYGKDLFITKLNKDGTAGTNEKLSYVIPFNQHNGPSFDGERYLYFHHYGGSRFGRFDIETREFETLKNAPRQFNDNNVNTFCVGGFVYAFDTSNNGMKYDIKRNEWSDCALKCQNWERFTVHPWNKTKVISIGRSGAVRVLSIATGRVINEYKSKPGEYCFTAVRCVIRAPNNEFLVIYGSGCERSWKVFSSATDTYSSNLPWAHLGECISAAVLDEKNSKFFYHVHQKDTWTCVNLPK